MKNKITLDISTATIIKILIVLAGAWLIINLHSIIVVVFIAFIIATALRPLVKRLETSKIPRSVSTILIYLILIILILLLVYTVSKPFAEQISMLIKNSPEIISSIQSKIPFLSNVDLVSYAKNLSNSLNNPASVSNNFDTAIKAATGVFDVFTSILTIIIISLYLTLGLDEITKSIIKYVPKQNREYVMKNYIRVEEQVGAWVRGEIILMIIIGLTTFISLKILGIPFAFSLAILAGILEILPLVGPIIYSTIIVLVSLTVSPLTAILALIACLVIQQAEAHLIVPLTMKRAIGLSPVVTIICILSGATLYGIIGALLSIPLAAVVSAILKERAENN